MAVNTSTIASRLAKSRKTRTSTFRTRQCPHCDRNLTLKTFKRHQRLYCRSDGTWISGELELEESMDEGLFVACTQAIQIGQDKPSVHLLQEMSDAS